MSPERSPLGAQRNSGESDSLESAVPEINAISRKEWWGTHFPGKRIPKMPGERRRRSSGKASPKK